MDNSPITRSEIDQALRSSAFITNPYPLYQQLRDHHPVFYSNAWGVWVLTRYKDVATILRDPARFSSAERFSTLLDQLPAEVQPHIEPLRRHYTGGLIISDPPDHTRLRTLVRDTFSAASIQNLRPRVQSVVDSLLDRVAPTGRLDLIHDLAYPLPIAVISEMLGLPGEDSPQLIRWSEDLTGLQAAGGAQVESAIRAVEAIVQLEHYFRDICFERRRRPGPDLISFMIDARDSADRLSDDELINMCTTFLIAGHETTKSLIGNAIWVLLHHPSAREQLGSDSSLMPSAIEEFLRYQSPIQRAWRRVAHDLDYEGHTLSAGQLVFLMLGSANRDPAQFSRPDELDLRRKPNTHVAFGYGIHFCLGAPLARMEAPIAIGTLLARFRNLRADGAVDWLGSIHVRSPRSLPLAFDP